jgi:hypothetical protein
MKEDVMKKILWILAAIGALLLAVAALRADEGPEKAAEEAARSWLGLVDAGNYAESWSQAASLFKKQVTAEQWQTAAGNARDPLGKVLSRRPKSAEYAKTLPGAPDGEYVVITYDTSFENKKAGVEVVTPMKDRDGVWRVAGYFVK